MPGRFSGRTAIVTGAAQGIGAAVARRISADGGNVVLVDVDGETLASLERELPGPAVAVVADVSVESEVAAYTRRAVSEFGSLDLVHNNAGIIGHLGAPLTEVSTADFDRTLAVNARGMFFGVRAAIQRMVEQGRGGSIVNTSSAVGVAGGQGLAPYVMSKHAVVGLTRAAAMEFAGLGVRVNVVCPGFIDTEMNRAPHVLVGEGDEAVGRRRLESGLPTGRYGRPDEVAALVTWLLSDEASYVSGGVFPVDGALTTGFDVHQQEEGAVTAVET